MLSDAGDSDRREVLDYVRKYSGPDIPRWVLQADVCDALILNNWLWWEDRCRELYFLKAGRDRGLFCLRSVPGSASGSRVCWTGSTDWRPCFDTTGPTRRSAAPHANP